MDDASTRDTAQLRHAEGVALGAARENGLLADAAMDLLHCRSSQDVYAVAGDFMFRLIPDAVVIVNEATPDVDCFITRNVSGLDGSSLSKAANLMGFQIIGMRADIAPDLRNQLLSGTLSKIQDGIGGLASSSTFRPLAEAAGVVAVLRGPQGHLNRMAGAALSMQPRRKNGPGE